MEFRNVPLRVIDLLQVNRFRSYKTDSTDWSSIGLALRTSSFNDVTQKIYAATYY